MGTQGSLHDMTVADLIQVNCQDHKTGKLSLNNGAMQGNLYFKNGNVIHAEMGQLQGEAAVYELLSWEEGLFKLDVAMKRLSPPLPAVGPVSLWKEPGCSMKN